MENSFRYTLPGGKLNLSQRRFYEDNGYIIVKQLVTPDKLQKFKDRFAQICRGEVKVPGLVVMRDIAVKDSKSVQGEQAINKIQDFQCDEELFQYCTLPEIVENVESFTGPNIVACNMLFINKPPDAGRLTSRHPLHQDIMFFPVEPCDRAVCSWTALQTVNRENGCLSVVPGSHQGQLLDHEYPRWEGGVNWLYHGVKDYQDLLEKRVHLVMEPGDTVFFHPLLVHGSGANRSKDCRKCISCHFISGDAHYVDVKNTNREGIEQETVAMKKKIGGANAPSSLQDYFRSKCRLIKGRDNLNRPAPFEQNKAKF